MNIALINGSPKKKDSASEIILSEIKSLLGNNNINEISLNSPKLENPENFSGHDILVFSFPLYIDGIPSHLLSCLCELEQYFRQNPSDTMVYAMSNNGFFEGEQNKYAIELMKNWCIKSGLKWGGGLGVGAGGMLGGLKDVPAGKGPKKNISLAINKLSENILNKKENGIKFVSPNLPRFMYILVAIILHADFSQYVTQVYRFFNITIRLFISS